MAASDSKTGFGGWSAIVAGWLACLLVAGDLPAEGESEPASDRDAVPSFNLEVRPILARCLACHGPDAAARLADLRLDRREDAISNRRGGRVIDPDRPEGSLLLHRIESDDPDLIMPPPGTGRPLDQAEIDVLRRWIEAGAPYERHWAWVSPSESDPIPNSGQGWARRDLDRYVARDHQANGLVPSPEADLETLCRRVSLDLVGLPPSPEQIDRVLADARTRGRDLAYEAWVDRLLADDAFGERWARVWLDVARYADTRGYEADRRRTMWPWRDWVIRAFNDDLPFDRFTVAQLAGDLVDGEDDDLVLATAFHRNTMTNDEGGTRDEEFRVAAVVDRVNTTFTTWMGLTAECAACHDHKYDPLSTEEYYELMAFFNTTQDADRNDEQPLLEWLQAEDRRQRRDLRDQRRVIEDRRDLVVRNLGSESKQIPADRIPIFPDVRPPGAVPGDDAPGGRFRWDMQVEPPPGWQRARRLDVGPNVVAQHYFQDVAPDLRLEIAPGDRFEAWFRLDPANPPASVMIQVHALDGAWEHRAYLGKQGFPLGIEDTGSRRRIGDLPAPGEWARLEFTAEDVGLAPGSIVTGVACSTWGDADGGTLHWGAVSVVRSDADVPGWLNDAESWAAAELSVQGRGLPPEVAASLAPGLSGDVDAAKVYQRHWRGEVSPAGIAATVEFQEGLSGIDLAIAKIDAAAHKVPVLREQMESQRRTTHVLTKGDWRSPGEAVAPGVPAFLHDLDSTGEPDRLALAEWIVDEDNPLTARVHVNRVWERLFGLGLVETQEDFGTQGIPPRHHDLLDHLARRFMELDWSHKALCREIATSATYRQSSGASGEAWESDPRNESLARGPRFRLEAEAIRDAALAVSGRLSEKPFGPPVFPPQPDGVWQVVYSGDSWTTSDGDDRYRRGLYTFWRRTSPHPAMTTLDAGSRETCSVRRIRTNTPLQALVLLNDQSFVEAAGGLAIRGIREGGMDPAESIARTFRLALGRAPSDQELEVLLRLQSTEAQRFQDRPEDAVRLLEAARAPLPDGVESARLAAEVVVCNVILNLDEFLVRN